MSFQNAPQYNGDLDTNGDSYWRHKGANGHARSAVSEKIHDFLRDGQQLPMYKDKPHYATSRRRGFLYRRGRFFALGLLCGFVLWYLGIPPFSGFSASPASRRSSWSRKPNDPTLWRERREAVKEAFKISWSGYEKYAWGMDEYHTVSKGGRNMVEGGMGWIIVDSLDTAILMNLTDEVSRAREWISTSLSYNADHDVNTFETTIRMLGGLLSAYYLSTTYPHLAPILDDDTLQPGEDLYIEKATDLADKLLGAYDTPSGIPLASINLNTSKGIPSGDGLSSTAEAATLQLEMKHLSKITGEPVYWERSEQIIKLIDDQQMEGGLVPIFIHPTSGTFRGQNIRLGSRGDSYYEYLIKQYLQTRGGEPVYKQLWDEALTGIKKYLITWTKNSNLCIIGERPNGLQYELTPKMDHLVAFMPGTIALGITNGSTVNEAKARLGPGWTKQHDEDMRLAEELMKSFWGMYKVTATGLAPEISYFHIDDSPRRWSFEEDWNMPVSDDLDDSSDAPWHLDYDIHPQDVHNLQRPETVESLFYMYHITRDPKYRDWGWQMFEAFREHTKVIDDKTGQVYAYSSLDTVMDNPVKRRKVRDNMESFWLAETLKYFYLLFSDLDGSDGLPRLEDIVINTEAHILPRFDISGSKIWKTGWTRMPRVAKADSVATGLVTDPPSKREPETPSKQSTFGPEVVAASVPGADGGD
jgi:endoplasmic reticulum Man9GlcNAc2 1,2-alpha-mannosidase